MTKAMKLTKSFGNCYDLKNFRNDIYNFQDTIILCKIFENGPREMMCKFP